MTDEEQDEAIGLLKLTLTCNGHRCEGGPVAWAPKIRAFLDAIYEKYGERERR